ncbi:hypothetical protein [Blastococcus sp. SYSU DS0539]
MDAFSVGEPPTAEPPAEEPPAEEPPTTEPPAGEPPTAAPEPPAAVLVPGEAVEVRNPATGGLVLSVTVAEVLPGVSCTDPAVVANNGSLVAVRVTVTTGADLTVLGGEHDLGAGEFRLDGDDGTVATGSAPAGVCDTGATPFPGGPLGPSQELTGTVVLDVPALSGVVRYQPEWLTAGDA